MIRPGTPSLPVPSALQGQKGLGAEEQEGRRRRRPGKGGGKRHEEAKSRKTALSGSLASLLPMHHHSVTSLRARPRLGLEDNLLFHKC